MRAFFGLSVPDEVKTQLAAAVQRLAPQAVDVAWCKRDQFHVTLAFLGEIAPAILPHVTAAAARVCAARPAFTCEASGFGFFGTKRNPKTLWAGITPTAELNELYESLWPELKKFGYVNREAEFRPHITLGRCREGTRNQALVQAMDADEAYAFGEWDVTRVTLYESRLTPHGAIYRGLAHAALAG